MKESTLVNKIQKYCKDNNIYCVKIWGGGYQSAGIPDLLLCLDGKFVALETKVGKNKTSALQKWHLEQIEKSGGKTSVPYTYQEAIDFITKNRNEM